MAARRTATCSGCPHRRASGRARHRSDQQAPSVTRHNARSRIVPATMASEKYRIVLLLCVVRARCEQGCSPLVIVLADRHHGDSPQFTTVFDGIRVPVSDRAASSSLIHLPDLTHLQAPTLLPTASGRSSCRSPMTPLAINAPRRGKRNSVFLQYRQCVVLAQLSQ